jgi:predicted TIM-barrel fold metal-dependent hydrolase
MTEHAWPEASTLVVAKRPTMQQEKPDDAVLFDLLAEWVPEEATRTRVLTLNPETLYGFTKLA